MDRKLEAAGQNQALSKFALLRMSCGNIDEFWSGLSGRIGDPFLDFEKGVNVNYVEDNSIISNGFQDTPVQTGRYVEKSGSMNLMYTGLNKILYWAFGFQNAVISVCAFTITEPSVEPTGGATYRDEDDNDFTFLRKEVFKSVTYYIFRIDDTEVPTLATGDLTKQAGTGDNTLSFTARSALMYEHLFELDAHERHLAAFRTAEQIGAYAPGNLKNRMATIGVRTTVTDLLYPHAMCKRFGLKSSAGQLASVDYSSSNWTLPAAILSNNMNAVHHHMRFKVGESESSLSNLGITEVNLGAEIPLDLTQDTESGLYLAEPHLEGKYSISLDAKLSRYSAETYQTLRDADTPVVCKLEAQYGYYLFEIFFNRMKVVTAGPDSSNVTQEPLKFESCYSTSNAWPTSLYGNSLVQSSPVVCRVRNLISDNAMFL
jgi:hypothetical protein